MTRLSLFCVRPDLLGHLFPTSYPASSGIPANPKFVCGRDVPQKRFQATSPSRTVLIHYRLRKTVRQNAPGMPWNGDLPWHSVASVFRLSIIATRITPVTSTCNRSVSRLYFSCKCGYFGCTCNLLRPLKPMQIISKFQVVFYLMPSSGRRRNKVPPPARRSRDRAFRGARPAFRPSVPD